MRPTVNHLLAAAVALGAGVAQGHARIKPGSTLEPRDTNAGHKLNPPCDAVPVDEAKRKTFTPGETITVQWEETVQHPGYFRFLLLDAEENEIAVLIDRFDDVQDGAIPPTFHQYSTTLTLPNQECENCVIQFVQVMNSNPASLYFSCADVRIKAAGGTDTDTDTATDTATTTDTATSTDTGTTGGPLPAPTGVIVDVLPDDGTELKAAKKGGAP